MTKAGFLVLPVLLLLAVPAYADDMMFDLVPDDRPVPQAAVPVAQPPPTVLYTTTITTTRQTTTHTTSSFMPEPIVLSPAEVDAVLRKNANTSAHDD